MEVILKFVTLFAFLCVLLLISAVWLIAVLTRKKSTLIGRAIIIFLLLLIAVIYIQPRKEGKLNLVDLKNWIFAEKISALNYQVEERRVEPHVFTQYYFSEPWPRLALSMEKGGQFFHITDVRPVNRVLRELGLPEVTEGVPELSSITGSRLDVNQYRWDDYAQGTLLIERSTCQEGESLTRFHCLIYLQVIRRY